RMQIMNGRQNVLSVTSGRAESDLPIFPAAPPFAPPAKPALQAGDLVISDNLSPHPCPIAGRADLVNHTTVLVPRSKWVFHRVPASQQLEIRHANRRRPNANPRPTRHRHRISDLDQT